MAERICQFLSNNASEGINLTCNSKTVKRGVLRKTITDKDSRNESVFLFQSFFFSFEDRKIIIGVVYDEQSKRGNIAVTEFDKYMFNYKNTFVGNENLTFETLSKKLGFSIIGSKDGINISGVRSADSLPGIDFSFIKPTFFISKDRMAEINKLSGLKSPKEPCENLWIISATSKEKLSSDLMNFIYSDMLSNEEVAVIMRAASYSNEGEHGYVLGEVDTNTKPAINDYILMFMSFGVNIARNSYDESRLVPIKQPVLDYLNGK